MFFRIRWLNKIQVKYQKAGRKFYVLISPTVVSAPAARDAQLAEVLGFVKKGPVENQKIGQTTTVKKTSIRQTLRLPPRTHPQLLVFGGCKNGLSNWVQSPNL